MRCSCSAALLCAAALLLLACGDDEDEGSPPSSKPVGAAPATDRPLPGSFAPLKPETTYATQKFTPAMRVAPAEGEWTTETGDSVEHFSLARQDAGPDIDQALIAVHRITRVFDPKKGGTIPGDEVPFEGDFAAWLADHRHLRASRPKAIELTRLKGVQLDVTSRSAPPKVPDDCGKLSDPCVALFHDGLDDVMYGGDSKGRWTVLELEDGGQLVIEQYIEPRGRFGDGLKALAPTLASLELAG